MQIIFDSGDSFKMYALRVFQSECPSSKIRVQNITAAEKIADRNILDALPCILLTSFILMTRRRFKKGVCWYGGCVRPHYY
jgi:hypothetical protein